MQQQQPGSAPSQAATAQAGNTDGLDVQQKLTQTWSELERTIILMQSAVEELDATAAVAKQREVRDGVDGATCLLRWIMYHHVHDIDC